MNRVSTVPASRVASGHFASSAASTVRQEHLARMVAVADHEGAILITGQPGAGKSRLLDACTPAAGIITCRLRINRAESTMALSGLSAIAASFDGSEARELAGSLLEQTEESTNIAARAAQLLALIRASEQPSTLLLVDDIDRMDEASQAVIAMVASRLGGTGLSIIATASSDVRGGALTSIAQLELPPLGFDDAAALAAEIVRSPLSRAVLRIVAEASAGNPEAIARNIRSLTKNQLSGEGAVSLPFNCPSEREPESADFALPGSAHQLILSRLSCAHLNSRDAVLRDFGDQRSVIDDLVSAGSVCANGRYWSITDPLLRSQLYSALDSSTRRTLHADAARAEAKETGLAAWHSSRVDTNQADAGVLFAAAADFAQRGFIWQSVELAERALAAIRDEFDCSTALFSLADTLLLRGELAYAGRYARLGQRLGRDPRVARRLAVLRTRIEFLATDQLMTADVDDWVNLNGQENPDDAAYELAIIAQCQAERWELGAARESLDRARLLMGRCSRETADIVTLTGMLVAAFEGDSGPANRMFDQVSREGIANTPASALALLGRSLMLVGRHSESRRIFKAIMNLEPAPEPLWLDSTRYWSAENEMICGNQFEALTMIEELDEVTDRQTNRSLHSLFMAWYWLVTGDHERAEVAIAECHRAFAAAQNSALAALLAAIEGRFALLDRRLDDAVAFLRMAASIGAGLGNNSLLRYQCDLIEACVLSGRLTEATEQFRELHARSLRYRSRWTILSTARAHALVTQGQPSVAAFQRAVRSWKPGDLQFELGRICLSFAERLENLGLHRESREQYLAARMIFTQLGAMVWARASEAPKQVLPPTSEHPLLASLAPDERLVADLVSRGLRNKEVAAELIVSLRTVEVRLTRIYQKLGARSRSHLTAMLNGADPQSFAQSTG